MTSVAPTRGTCLGYRGVRRLELTFPSKGRTGPDEPTAKSGWFGTRHHPTDVGTTELAFQPGVQDGVLRPGTDADRVSEAAGALQ